MPQINVIILNTILPEMNWLSQKLDIVVQFLQDRINRSHGLLTTVNLQLNYIDDKADCPLHVALDGVTDSS